MSGSPRSAVQVAAGIGALSSPAVLVDVGASGSPPAAWRALASAAAYLGFDPDQREVVTEDPYGFVRFAIIPKAVSDDPSAATVTFHLTRSPFCSSLLAPNWETLDAYGFSELFEVERTVDVPAVTLDRALDELALGPIDWLKLDTQGKDLDFYRSLGDARRQGLLAIDVEPGVLPFYEGENTFDEVHRALVADGFWLSRLELQRYVRVERATRRSLAALGRSDALEAIAHLPGSPTATEARYLRTISHLERRGCAPRDWALLWLFAMTDDRPGFALDVATHAAARPETADLGRSLLAHTLLSLPRTTASDRLRSVLRRVVPAPVRRGLRSTLDAWLPRR